MTMQTKKASRLLPALLCLLLAVLLPACQAASQVPQARQGIQGRVLLRSGNHMPGPGRSLPPDQPASREIHVYALTHVSQVRAAGSFYSQIQTKQVAKFVSGPDGAFRLALPPGKYSLFVREAAGLFANRFDGEGHLFPVEVLPGQLTPVEIVIDYNASY
ncbi:MAG: carboxypeptidase regulatory-like domain-containing protein [Adhaeribacter sp.]